MDITEKLRNRINELYQNYMTVLLGRSKREIIDKAEDIAFVKKITDLIDDDAEELPPSLYEQFVAREREALRALIMEQDRELAQVYRFDEPEDEADEGEEL